MNIIQELKNLSKNDKDKFELNIINRLKAEYGDKPNIARDEGYEDILLSLYYEDEFNNTLLEDAVILALEEFWNLKDAKSFSRATNLAYKILKKHKYHYEFLPPDFDWSDEDNYEIYTLALNLLLISNREILFWDNNFRTILSNYSKSNHKLKDALLCAISGINLSKGLHFGFIWLELISKVSAKNILTNFLFDIISDQWIYCEQDIECEKAFLQSFEFLTQENIKYLELFPLELKEELLKPIEFLLKHPMSEDNIHILNSIKLKLDELNYDSTEEDKEKLAIEFSSLYPKQTNENIKQKAKLTQNANLPSSLFGKTA